MKHLFLLTGNFGSGKTSIVNAYPHKPVSKYVTEVQGIWSLGGEKGADALLGLGMKKAEALTIISSRPDKDFIVHSVYYQKHIDLERYTASHKLVVIFLEVSAEENKRRILARGGRWNEETFKQTDKALKKLRVLCEVKGIDYTVIKADRPLEEVSADVWEAINSYVQINVN